MRRILWPAAITVLLSFFVFSVSFAQTTYSYPVDGEAGWPELRFTLKRADLWTRMPDGEQPQNDLFFVLLAEITAREQRSSCLYKRNYELQIGEKTFKTPESSDVDSIRAAYEGIDDPRSFVGTCADKGETKAIFIWFDVQEVPGPVTLKLDGGGEILLANSFEQMLVDAGLNRLLTPVSAAAPNATPTPLLKTTGIITGALC